MTKPTVTVSVYNPEFEGGNGPSMTTETCSPRAQPLAFPIIACLLITQPTATLSVYNPEFEGGQQTYIDYGTL